MYVVLFIKVYSEGVAGTRDEYHSNSFWFDLIFSWNVRWVFPDRRLCIAHNWTNERCTFVFFFSAFNKSIIAKGESIRSYCINLIVIILKINLCDWLAVEAFLYFMMDGGGDWWRPRSLHTIHGWITYFLEQPKCGVSAKSILARLLCNVFIVVHWYCCKIWNFHYSITLQSVIYGDFESMLERCALGLNINKMNRHKSWAGVMSRR